MRLGIGVILTDLCKAELTDASGFQPAHSAERSRKDTIRMLGHEVSGNDAAHGIADDVSLLDLEMIEEPDDIFDQFRTIVFLFRRFVRLTMTAHVQSDHAAFLGQRAADTGQHPIELAAGQPAVDENYRRSVALD